MSEMENRLIASGPNRNLAVKRLLKEGFDYEEVMEAFHSLQKRGLAPISEGQWDESRNEFDQKDLKKSKSIREVYQNTRKPLHGHRDAGHSRVLRWDDGLYRSKDTRGVFAKRTKTPAQSMASRWSLVPGRSKLGGDRGRAEEVEDGDTSSELLRGRKDR